MDDHFREIEVGETTIWLQKLKEDPTDFPIELWKLVFDRLLGYADRKLGGLPRRTADEEDLVLSAIHDFHRGVVSGKFPELNNSGDLWKILLTIVSRKTGKRIREFQTIKRGSGAVRGESIFGDPEQASGGLHEIPAVLVSETLTEECRELLDQLGDSALQKVAIMKLQGYTSGEIAEIMGCAIRTVERKLELIRTIWR